MAKLDTIEQAEQEIRKQAKKVGFPFTHNVLTMTLQIVDERFGRKEANRLIKKYKLKHKFGICEEPENESMA